MELAIRRFFHKSVVLNDWPERLLHTPGVLSPHSGTVGGKVNYHRRSLVNHRRNDVSLTSEIKNQPIHARNHGRNAVFHPLNTENQPLNVVNHRSESENQSRRTKNLRRNVKNHPMHPVFNGLRLLTNRAACSIRPVAENKGRARRSARAANAGIHSIRSKCEPGYDARGATRPTFVRSSFHNFLIRISAVPSQTKMKQPTTTDHA